MSAPKVLVVENDAACLRQVDTYLRAPSPAIVDLYGRVEFEVSHARWKERAMELLDTSTRDSTQRFDVVLLDLMLPETEAELELKDNHLQEHGVAVLEKAAAGGFAAVIVISVIADARVAVDMLKSGALDYLQKRYLQEPIFWSVLMGAWRKAYLRYMEWFRLKRFDRVLGQARDELADRYTSLLTAHAGDVLQETERLERHLGRRFALDADRDGTDPVMQSVLEIRGASRRALEQAAAMRGDPTRGIEHAGACVANGQATNSDQGLPDAPYERCDLAALASGVADNLKPMCLFQQVRILLGTREQWKEPVQTFTEDVREILQEVLFGSIEAHNAPIRPSGAPTPPTMRSSASTGRIKTVLISIVGDRENRCVNIIIEDLAPTLPSSLRAELNAGRAVGTENPRAWGLYLARRMAHNIGAGLDVGTFPPEEAPCPGGNDANRVGASLAERGNVVSLRLPVPEEAFRAVHTGH